MLIVEIHGTGNLFPVWNHSNILTSAVPENNALAERSKKNPDGRTLVYPLPNIKYSF